MKIHHSIFLILFYLTGFPQSNSPNPITVIDSIGSPFAFQKIKLNSEKWQAMGLDALETYQSYFDYSIINKFEILDSNIYIVERTSSNEECHWTCIINNDEKLLDWIITAYDNTEGFAFTSTSIQEDKLVVKKWNMYSKPKESITIYFIVDRKFKQ